MSASVLFMSMSLDGFIAGLNDGPDNPGGDDGAVERLHQWSNPAADDARSAAALKEMEGAMNATGAVVAGRRTVEQVDHWGGDHHGAPIFVVSHRPAPASAAAYPMVTYVTDGIESAMAQAKSVAGDRDVFVHGAYTAQRALQAGVLDELPDPPDPGAARRGAPPVRRPGVADRTGHRSCDRHADGDASPLPGPPVTRTPSGDVPQAFVELE